MLYVEPKFRTEFFNITVAVDDPNQGSVTYLQLSFGTNFAGLNEDVIYKGTREVNVSGVPRSTIGLVDIPHLWNPGKTIIFYS